MFEVNSHVMYGKIGVCLISEIKDGRFIGKPKSRYYVLHPVFSNDLEIMLPEKSLKTHIRKLASKEEVFSLLESMPEQESIWEDDSKQRNARFMDALNSGRCEDWIVIIQSIYQKSKEYKLEDKKISSSDEAILKDAKRLLHEEFSYSLNLQPDEVELYIQNYLSKKQLAS